MVSRCFSQYFVADPTEVEERATEGRLTVGMNSYREICTLHLTGRLLLNKQQVSPTNTTHSQQTAGELNKQQVSSTNTAHTQQTTGELNKQQVGSTNNR